MAYDDELNETGMEEPAAGGDADFGLSDDDDDLEEDNEEEKLEEFGMHVEEDEESL